MSAARDDLDDSLPHLAWHGLRASSTPLVLYYLEDRNSVVRFAAARVLHLRPSGKALARGTKLLRSEAMRKREIAAYLLSQLGTPRRPYKKESTRILLRALSRERNAAVRAMIILALGKLKARPALYRVLSFANDRAPQVRREVALYIGMIYCDRSKSIPPRFMRLLRQFNAERSRVVRWGASLALELVRGPTTEERAARRAYLAEQRKKARK